MKPTLLEWVWLQSTDYKMTPQELFDENELWARRLVVKRFKFHANRIRENLQVIVNAGLLGLWKACLNFNPEITEFKTYAYMRIVGSCWDCLREERNARMGLRREVETVQMSTMTFSNDRETIIEHGRIDKELKKVELRDLTESLLKRLQPRELFVVSQHILEGNTLGDIARVLDLSESRICQIYNASLEKLRLRK